MWKYVHPVKQKISDPKPYNRALLYKLCINAPRSCTKIASHSARDKCLHHWTWCNPTQQLCPKYHLCEVFSCCSHRVSSLCCCWIAFYGTSATFILSISCTASNLSFGLVKSVFHKTKTQVKNRKLHRLSAFNGFSSSDFTTGSRRAGKSKTETKITWQQGTLTRFGRGDNFIQQTARNMIY